MPPIVPLAEQPPTFTFVSLLNQNQEQWFSLAGLNAREIILSSETFLCTTVPVNQEQEEAKSFTLFVPGSEGRVQIPMQTYWQPGQFLECKGETGVSLR
ncbi:hypothetical protein [Synechococcus sp. C9]|uniref:hypothetical protein n=1 Tax=Synechococcus sp. C9 TaxID=102119 RepID=UPI001FF4A6F6|nr:hypothetical protein [Synechococcus sp. C9]